MLRELKMYGKRLKSDGDKFFIIPNALHKIGKGGVSKLDQRMLF